MSAERTDIFGRTEQQIVVAIARGERTYNISKVYSGAEGLAINLARRRASIEVDKRQLSILRGVRVVYDPPLREMTSRELGEWRHGLAKRGSAGIR